MLLWLAGCGQEGPEVAIEDETILVVGLPGEKTSIGASQEGKRKVFWADGDCISLNGVVSDALSGVGEARSSADFRVPGVFDLPYSVLYPASYYKDAATITLPAAQTYSSGSAIVPMACSVTEAGSSAGLSHLCTILRLAVTGSDQLVSVSFKGNAGEQVSGDFTIDYKAATLTPASTAEADKEFTITVGQALSADTPLELFLCLPAGNYASGFTVTLTGADNQTMTVKRGSSINCVAGHVLVPATLAYDPSVGSVSFDLELGGLDMDVLVMNDYNVQGRVVDNAGNPVEGVVVTDGEVCVKTMFDGSFYMQSELDATDFIYISTPAGYLPEMQGGIPVFYKRISSLSTSGGVLQCGDFVLTPVANPNNATLFFTADPQPRDSKWSMDNIAYRSLACCNDMYRELRETAAGISGRQVYGICLGDIVHEDMSLYSNYAEGLSTLGYPTFNVIGNHDNDPEADDDAAGAAPFESWFGPRNYSFNIGKMHFVVLDDISMYRENGALKSYNNGLDDIAWNWLKADLAKVPKTTTLMVCAHGPMFRKAPDGEVSSRDATLHGEDYGTLIRSFSKVHAWAGHTHCTFNYIYPASHRYRNLEVHTLSRSTGELWTNEYLSGGTPRGFTIVEIRNGVVSSWRFHPTKYQSGAFHGPTEPSFKYRDWTYVSGVAKMNNGGATLDESYQMHVYPPGSYASGDGYLYVNVFLWDTKWDTPVFVSGGSSKTMELVTSEDRYDLGEIEMSSFYKANASILKNYSGYPAVGTNYPNTLFRVAAPASGSGTVKVTDRFDNEYSQTVTW